MKRFLMLLSVVVFLLASVGTSWAQGSAGTVNAKQSGTWNITNISGTITLPTGAATAAKQPALGTAGTASADVLSIQGIASMTPVVVSGSGIFSTTQGAFTTLTTGQQAVTASAVALATTTASRVCVKVLIGGTQVVYFGPTGVATTTGQELSPGDSWCGPVSNTNKIFVIAANTGSTIAWDLLN